jgi:hypothetical protein
VVHGDEEPGGALAQDADLQQQVAALVVHQSRQLLLQVARLSEARLRREFIGRQSVEVAVQKCSARRSAPTPHGRRSREERRCRARRNSIACCRADAGTATSSTSPTLPAAVERVTNDLASWMLSRPRCATRAV